MSETLTDRSDLLAGIQVYFRVLAFVQPSQKWGWSHPALVAWMEQRDRSHWRQLSDDQLQQVLKFLQSAYLRNTATNHG